MLFSRGIFVNLICWRPMQHMVDNVLLIKYNSNRAYFSLFVLCSLPHYFIISCPHLAEFDPIPALYQKGFNTWNLTVQQFIRSKLKCIYLFVQTWQITCYCCLAHPIYCALVNNICPLLGEEWHSRLELHRQMKNVHRAEWGLLMVAMCECVCRSWTKSSIRKCWIGKK